MIWKGKELELKYFTEWLNTRTQYIKFKTRHSHSEINFLDFMIKHEDGHQYITLYPQETDRNTFLHYTSSHQRDLKDHLSFSQFLQIRCNCSKKDDYLYNARILLNKFRGRQYCLKLLMRLMKEHGTHREDIVLESKHKKAHGQIVCSLTFNANTNQLKKAIRRNCLLISNLDQYKEPLIFELKTNRNLRDNLVHSNTESKRVLLNGRNLL